ncbi:hypothetical protein TNCV_2557251 [Trichonephila clavipes]|nr:hypothetical protein TNCV_2557251 [Trichonephila clavipes]
MIYLWERCPFPGVGTRHPFRWGKKRRIHQIPSVVNNNRADVKITVAILGTDDLPSVCTTPIMAEERHFGVFAYSSKISLIPLISMVKMESIISSYSHVIRNEERGRSSRVV